MASFQSDETEANKDSHKDKQPNRPCWSFSRCIFWRCHIRHLIRMPPNAWNITLELEVDPEIPGKITCPIWPWSTSGSPHEELDSVEGIEVWVDLLRLLPCHLIPDKQKKMDRWVDASAL
ncbi:Hypothetical predicted protein [Xyrichtys novacula]|uniref:Uncharacterized protein n=1 Tax=Xyrichtys novacula TaxID=13765 RepID=A0AAV1F111_XYRNO|nr:Hypothetical predicted protein [Xyrichtys novacula]